MPISCLASAGFATTSIAPTYAEPELGTTRVVSMPAVVVLPAPLGPSSPKISPACTLRLSLSTAAKSVPAYTFVSSTVRMIPPSCSPPREPAPSAPGAGRLCRGGAPAMSPQSSAPALPCAAAMADTHKIAKNLERFAQAVAAHDRENPTHTAYGIGLAHFDMERLGLDEGEEILPGITIHADSGVTGNFRVLCDGEHDEQLTEAEEQAVEAIATQSLPVAPITPAFPHEN